jgi:hypothetical protein
MTDEKVARLRAHDHPPIASRFVLRKGAAPGKWMIWDRNIRRPAELERGLATGLSEEQARQLLVKLKLAYREE